MDGPDVVGIKAGLFGWAMLALAAVAVLGMLAPATGNQPGGAARASSITADDNRPVTDQQRRRA